MTEKILLKLTEEEHNNLVDAVNSYNKSNNTFLTRQKFIIKVLDEHYYSLKKQSKK